MISPRRAAELLRHLPGRHTLVLAGVLTAGAVGLMTASFALIAARLARMVVTPVRRIPNVEIVSWDPAAQTITLARDADTELPGRYGLFTDTAPGYLRLGSVLESTDTTVKRKLLTHVAGDAGLGAAASFSGWYYDRPEQLHLPYTSELIGSPMGPCPAWLFPSEVDTGDWVIQIHGRGTTRAETLRAVPVFRDLGYTSLLVSYRNDGEAPRSRTGMYALGATEWRDVDAAIAFARRHGAQRVVLMGWSMGGAIALQVALSSGHRDLIKGVVLDSPVIDWRSVLEFQAELMHVPTPVVGVALGALGTSWGATVVGAGDPIPFAQLDIVARAGELRHPVFIMHSDDDGFVPSEASHQLVVARPDLVEMTVFSDARHTKLWNYDQVRWTTAIGAWLRRHDLVSEAVSPPTSEGS